MLPAQNNLSKEQQEIQDTAGKERTLNVPATESDIRFMIKTRKRKVAMIDDGSAAGRILNREIATLSDLLYEIMQPEPEPEPEVEKPKRKPAKQISTTKPKAPKPESKQAKTVKEPDPEKPQEN
jgi:hypothetical protein